MTTRASQQASSQAVPPAEFDPCCVSFQPWWKYRRSPYEEEKSRLAVLPSHVPAARKGLPSHRGTSSKPVLFFHSLRGLFQLGLVKYQAREGAACERDGTWCSPSCLMELYDALLHDSHLGAAIWSISQFACGRHIFLIRLFRPSYQVSRLPCATTGQGKSMQDSGHRRLKHNTNHALAPEAAAAAAPAPARVDFLTSLRPART